MTKNAIIIHGKANRTKYYDLALESPSNSAWLPWLQKQLLINDILAQTPEMPLAWQPVYKDWCREFERYDISSETILVGHSCGAGFLIRWLCDHPDVCVGKVVLVAPWIDPDDSGGMDDFFDFTFDPTLVKRADIVTVFNSTDDFPNAQTSAKMIVEAIPGVKLRNFDEHGHFVDITEFPELRDTLLA